MAANRSGHSTVVSSHNASVFERTLTLVSVAIGTIFTAYILIWATTQTDAMSVRQFQLVRTIIALAAGCLGATIPGFLSAELRLPKALTVRAVGATALFVITYFFVPAVAAGADPEAGGVIRGTITLKQDMGLDLDTRQPRSKSELSNATGVDLIVRWDRERTNAPDGPPRIDPRQPSPTVSPSTSPGSGAQPINSGVLVLVSGPFKPADDANIAHFTYLSLSSDDVTQQTCQVKKLDPDQQVGVQSELPVGGSSFPKGTTLCMVTTCKRLAKITVDKWNTQGQTKDITLTYTVWDSPCENSRQGALRPRVSRDAC